MTDDPMDDALAGAFGRALAEADTVPWHRWSVGDLAARRRRRRRNRIVAVVATVLLVGAAGVGWSLLGAEGVDRHESVGIEPPTTAPTTTTPTTTTTSCPSRSDPTAPCALAAGVPPGAPAIRPPAWRGPPLRS